MAVILFQPQIPQNAGNIVRLCACTGQDLVLVRPLGFSTSDRALRRAGLDYWEGVNVDIITDLDEYLETTSQEFYFFSSHSSRPYTEITYQNDDLLVFGSETNGLPERYFEKYPERFFTIPMLPDQRCLNLSNSVSIVVYESWRQRSWEPAKQVTTCSA